MQITDTAIYLHQSDLGTLRMCPEQARLGLTGELFDATSDSAFIGTLTHSFIQSCLERRRGTGLWPDDDQLTQIITRLRERLADEWHLLWLHPREVEDFDQALGFVVQACQNWWVNVKPGFDDLDPTGWLIEHKFDELLGEVDHEQIVDMSGYGEGGWIESYDNQTKVYEVRLRGEIDFADVNAAQIWDWKTSKAASKYNLWKLQNYDVQSNVYSWAIKQAFGFIPTFNYVHLTRGSDQVEVNSLTPTEGNLDMMSQEMMSWADTILTLGPDKPWPKSPSDWWCSSRWCSHHARGLCAGSQNQMHAEEAVHLTRLLPSSIVDDHTNLKLGETSF